ncbi:zinc-binding dehydrogenase [Spongiivirga sp. MCCC 1A20706]|uniref:quinone oxidoreductase family protein n=1 Tax=Spongiivirga sp. MCCC 1A20706 TaxID=3160963 RepID=UPI003977C2DE
MKKAVVNSPGGPEKIIVEEHPIPHPKEDEVLIKVAYAALNPMDNHARADRIKWMHPGFPFTPGFEYSGTVEALGKGVNSSWVGKRIACNGQWGGCAEFAIAKANSLQEIPQGMDMKTGAVFSTCAYTAWLLIHSAAKMKPDQSLIIHSAAGAVGAMLIQVAKSHGVTVFALAGSDQKLAYANQFDPDHLINYTDPKWPEKVLTLNDGKGVDVIIDGNAGPNALRNFEVIAPHGNVIFIGAVAGQAPDINVSMLIGKNCSVTGFVQYFHQAINNGAEKEATHEALISKKWRIPIEKIYSLQQITQAHEAWENRELVGRTLIKIN